MRTTLKVIIYFLTAGVSFLSVTGQQGGDVDIDCDDTPVNKTAYYGGSVTIDCKYPREEEIDTKHFCKEDATSHCTNLISTATASRTMLDRFSLMDDKQRGVYNVTISKLTQNDNGTYQCVMRRSGIRTCLSKIHLHILNWDDITPRNISHGTGQTAQITCTYPDSHESNVKFLCKGENPFKCEELIQTTEQERDVDKGRFTIRDNRRIWYFYVYINDLRTDDSGTYWCGSDRTWQDAENTKVLLSVAPRQTKDSSLTALKPTESSSSQEGFDDSVETAEIRFKSRTLQQNDDSDTKPKKVPVHIIAPVVVGLAVLILVLVLVLCRHKLPRTQACCAAGGSSEQRTNAQHNTEGNHDYEEIRMRNQQASSGDALPSVYATVNLPADQLHYASVNFQKESVGVPTDGKALPDMNKNGSAACDYSSISRPQGATHPPAAESTLYSAVTKPGGP